AHEQVAMARLQITMDNGPESRGKRPPFLQRMVGLCDAMGKPMQRLYSPPLSPYIQSDRAVLGHLGNARERDQVGGRGDEGGGGQEDDVAGHVPDGRAQSEGRPTRGAPQQASDAGGGKPPGAPP